MKDPINPYHYTAAEIECIDAIQAALGAKGFKAYCYGNIIKYAWRANKKGTSEEDGKKAAWFSCMAAGIDPRSQSNPPERSIDDGDS